jgi:thiol-disulfide isomerase/thioredoxin
MAVVVAVVVAAGIYGIGARKASGNDECAPALAIAQKAAPLARGEVAAVAMATKPRLLPDVHFKDADGTDRKLSDWRGKTVLLNLWATWCVPCRREMPALDALSEKRGGPDFEVVAVNIDTRDADKPKTFLKEAGITHLAYHADASAKIFQDFKAIGLAFGMPTSILVGPKGCEIGALAGPAEWASPDAQALIQAVSAR